MPLPLPRAVLCGAAALLLTPPTVADGPALGVATPLSPPAWALLQRQLLRANAAACREFFGRYFDERGYLLCVERWGGDDGPDDAIENCTDWPILHALGAPDDIRALYLKAWEGHLRQYTRARTTDVPLARDGMYYKEFPVMFDWLHHSEGLTVFNAQGLSDPYNPGLVRRARRYAGFYMNEDPGAPNYDPRHRVIRSLFNGSRGPLLRRATALDWAGDPVEVENRFHPGHGERSYQEMLDHFRDYNDVVGDHPLNLLATTLAANAFLLTGEEKYRRWVREYVDAWRGRMAANNDIIPTNVGLDGTVGGACGGKWYGGVYGWGFSVKVPRTGAVAHRNQHHKGLTGFVNAFLLTGDDRYLDAWRRQIDAVNARRKVSDGKESYPTMHGDQGWYAYAPGRYAHGAREIYFLSMRPEDRARVPADPWLEYLEGKDPGYPEAALRRDLERVRRCVEGMRRDPTTPDTRLADDPLRYNPASVGSLIELMLGGLPPGLQGGLLHCRLRYFDPDGRRPGVPDGVAALVEKLGPDEATVTLVNTDQVAAKAVVVQAGGFAEHEFTRVRLGGRTVPLNARHFTVRLDPGAGARLVLGMRRHVHTPTLALPWDRGRWPNGISPPGGPTAGR